MQKVSSCLYPIDYKQVAQTNRAVRWQPYEVTWVFWKQESKARYS